MSRFEDSIVIVTGAANGIGRGIATSFSAEGAIVVIADIDKKNGLLTETEIRTNGGQADFIQADVSDPESIKNLFITVKEKFGRTDVLINNAGISAFTSIFETSAEDWDRVLNTNLRGSFLCSKEASLLMREKGHGSIVNIASTRAFMSESNSEAYAASKGGIVALTHALAISLSEDKIRVNSISPGWIYPGDHDSLRDIDHSQHPSGRVGKPSDIARTCLFFSDPNNGFITGENLIIDGGMTKKMIYEH